MKFFHPPHLYCVTTLTTKKWLISVLNYQSYSKNKSGYPFFWITLYIYHFAIPNSGGCSNVESNRAGRQCTSPASLIENAHIEPCALWYQIRRLTGRNSEANKGVGSPRGRCSLMLKLLLHDWTKNPDVFRFLRLAVTPDECLLGVATFSRTNQVICWFWRKKCSDRARPFTLSTIT